MSTKKLNEHFDVEQYFTNVEILRELFKSMVVTPTPTKRILVIHGVGGVGKTSLLRMFRLQCKNLKMPVALVSGDEAKSIVDILMGWSNDLKKDGISLPKFNRTYKRYQIIQAKVEKQAGLNQKKISEVMGKAAVETVKATTGVAVGALIGSAIPGIGTIVGAAIGGVGAETLVDWLRGFLKKPDIELLLNPISELTDKFLSDISHKANKQRLVLILDTFEQLISFNNWTCNFVKNLHTNILFVVAGREMINWEKWETWLSLAETHLVEPMPHDVLKELIHRYYNYMVGGEPDENQVEAIIRFARGLPIVATSAARLWVKYRVHDFDEIKTEVVGDLIDRLLDGVPPKMVPILEAAATVRWFNKPILRTLAPKNNIDEEYEDLRHFPFVQPSKDGLHLHESIREILDDNLRITDPERHLTLHKLAMHHFEIQHKGISGADSEKTTREWLYHYFKVNETAGMQVFRKMAEEFARYQFVGRLRTLINDVNTYSLTNPNNVLWRDYYNARLFHISNQFEDAEQIYTRISKDKYADLQIRAYALCDLGQLWRWGKRLAQPGGIEKALSVIEQSQRLYPELDTKLATNFLNLRYIYMFKGELDKAADILKQQYNFYNKMGDIYGSVYSLDMLKDIHGLLGYWKLAADYEKEGLRIIDTNFQNSFLKTRLIGHNIWYKIGTGRYWEAEKGMLEALYLAEQEEQIESIPGLYRDLCFITGLQRKWKQANEFYLKSIKKYKERSSINLGLGSTYGFWGFILAKQNKLASSERLLINSLSIKEKIQDNNGIPEVLTWLGGLYEIKANQSKGDKCEGYLSKAQSYYQRCLDYRWTSRKYYECSALLGIVRTKCYLGVFKDIDQLSTQVEEIAKENQYYDLLALIYFLRGNLLWSKLAKGLSTGLDAIIMFYKLALLYALCHNRFLLDEIIFGDKISTPFIPLTTTCSQQGHEGKIVIKAIIDWWEAKLDSNELAVLNKTQSLNLADSSFNEVEELIRTHEPGNLELQTRVSDMLRNIISK